MRLIDRINDFKYIKSYFVKCRKRQNSNLLHVDKHILDCFFLTLSNGHCGLLLQYHCHHKSTSLEWTLVISIEIWIFCPTHKLLEHWISNTWILRHNLTETFVDNLSLGLAKSLEKLPGVQVSNIFHTNVYTFCT